MPTALWIAHVHVTDAEAYGKYAALAGPAIAAHGGYFLARAGRYVQLEGNDRARALYERAGFVLDRTARIGALRHVFGFAAAHVMVRAV